MADHRLPAGRSHLPRGSIESQFPCQPAVLPSKGTVLFLIIRAAECKPAEYVVLISQNEIHRLFECIRIQHLIIVEETDPVDFRLQQRKSAVPLGGRGWSRRPAQIVDTKRRKLPADGSDTLSGRIDHDNLIRPARLILQRLEHSPQIFGAISGWSNKSNMERGHFSPSIF